MWNPCRSRLTSVHNSIQVISNPLQVRSQSRSQFLHLTSIQITSYITSTSCRLRLISIRIEGFTLKHHPGLARFISIPFRFYLTSIQVLKLASQLLPSHQMSVSNPPSHVSPQSKSRDLHYNSIALAHSTSNQVLPFESRLYPGSYISYSVPSRTCLTSNKVQGLVSHLTSAEAPIFAYHVHPGPYMSI